MNRFKHTRRYMKATVRWYRQTAAHSNTLWISTADNQNVTEASAGVLLGAFHVLDYGAKVAVTPDARPSQLKWDSSMGAEYYQQTLAKRVASSSALRELDSYSSLKLLLIRVRFGY